VARLAQVCEAFDIPWLVIRALSDLAGADSALTSTSSLKRSRSVRLGSYSACFRRWAEPGVLRRAVTFASTRPRGTQISDVAARLHVAPHTAAILRAVVEGRFARWLWHFLIRRKRAVPLAQQDLAPERRGQPAPAATGGF